LYGGSCTKLEETNQASLKKNKEEEQEGLLLFILFVLDLFVFVVEL